MLTYFINRADVGMIQRGCRPRLTTKTFQRLRVLRQLVGQEFQGDEPTQVGVLGLIHHTHAAATELIHDAIVRDGLADHLPLSGTFRLVLRKDLKFELPRAETPTHHITMGFNEDLDDAAKTALREMIALIGERLGLSPEDAYMFCSLAVDMRVTQLVDGNKGIHAMLPKRYANRAN